MSIDLRERLNDFLNDYGNEVLYIRNSKYINCKCYSPTSKEGNNSCKICFGSGKLTSTEKTKVITDINVIRAGKETYTKIGLENNSLMYMYLPYDINPQPNDLVCFVGWSGKIPTNVIEVYKIRNRIDVRCDNGRVEAYYCILERAEKYESHLDNYVKTLPTLAVQTLCKGGKWVWAK